METLYRIAFACSDVGGETTVGEVRRRLTTICGQNWMMDDQWRFEASPYPRTPSFPVIVRLPERDLLVASLVDQERIIDVAVVSELQKRQWRHRQYQRAPFPNGEAFFPWENVGFRFAVPPDQAIAWIGAVANNPWKLEGDILIVTPSDAGNILRDGLPTTFEYLGRVRERCQY
ncbi:MAG: hypothetical protein IIZ63_06565 [Caulobacteraceae bacterium]|nr:hypothetical protein [Caulobacteraceae bacterium]